MLMTELIAKQLTKSGLSFTIFQGSRVIKGAYFKIELPVMEI